MADVVRPPGPKPQDMVSFDFVLKSNPTFMADGEADDAPEETGTLPTFHITVSDHTPPTKRKRRKPKTDKERREKTGAGAAPRKSSNGRKGKGAYRDLGDRQKSRGSTDSDGAMSDSSSSTAEARSASKARKSEKGKRRGSDSARKSKKSGGGGAVGGEAGAAVMAKPMNFRIRVSSGRAGKEKRKAAEVRKKKRKKKKAEAGPFLIRVYLYGFPKFGGITIDVTGYLVDMETLFARIEEAAGTFPRKFNLRRIFARDAETGIIRPDELQSGSYYLLCGDANPLKSSKIHPEFVVAEMAPGADWDQLQVQFPDTDLKTMQSLKKTFDMYDLDVSGGLDVEEIARALMTVLKPRGKYSQDEVYAMIEPLFAEFDTDQNDSVEFPEFLAFYTKLRKGGKDDSAALVEWRQSMAAQPKAHSKSCLIM